MQPASSDFILASVGSRGPVMLSRSLLIENSEYFRTMLEGEFAESRSGQVKIQWEGDEDNCVLFLTWIGVAYLPEKFVTSDCRVKFLKCCVYFKVKEDFLQATLQGITLPVYSSCSEEAKEALCRAHIPFTLLCELVAKVPNPYEQICYACSWMEGSTSSESERESVMQGDDFAQLRRLLAQKLLEIERTTAQGFIPKPGVSPAFPAQTYTKPGVASTFSTPAHARQGMASPVSTPTYMKPGVPVTSDRGREQPPNAQDGISNFTQLIAAVEKFPTAANAFNVVNFWRVAMAASRMQGAQHYY